jgi:uncharacterized protein YdhG (YjbR/CyaY superfamily)
MADSNNVGFSAAEKAAMKERAKELREAEKLEKNRAAGEAAVNERIAEMPPADRKLAEKVHALVSRVAPELMPRTWYGMPAYTRNGKTLFFFQDAVKFESRYATVGFGDNAALDDGDLWPTSFALVAWSDKVEQELTKLIKRAIS